MVIESITDNFLPANTEVLVSINPGDKLAAELREFLEDLPNAESSQSCGVRVRLLEDLKIRFKLFDTGKISRELRPCRCQASALPHVIFHSLNEAYQRISAVYETSRRSAGGKVYDNVYYESESHGWRLLEALREAVYAPHKSRFETKSTEIRVKETLLSGVRVPAGNCIFIRKMSCQPSLFNREPMEVTARMPLFDEDDHLACYGPIEADSLWEFVYCLQEAGLDYGKDFFMFHRPLPDWCWMLISAEAPEDKG